MSFAGLSLSKLLLDTETTLFALVGLKAIAFVTLCLHLMILHPISVDSRTGKWGQTRKLRERTESAVRQRFNIACDARTCGCTPVILYRPQCNILREGEVEGIAVTHGFDCRSVCACQCGLKGHGVIFRCFSSTSFVSMWNACKMRGGVTHSE